MPGKRQNVKRKTVERTGGNHDDALVPLEDLAVRFEKNARERSRFVPRVAGGARAQQPVHLAREDVPRKSRV